MSLLNSCLTLKCILKQLGPKQLTDPWDGPTSLGIQRYGAMMHDMIELLCAKFPCNFGGWKDFVAFHNEFKWFGQNIKMNTYLRKNLEMMIGFVESMQV